MEKNSNCLAPIHVVTRVTESDNNVLDLCTNINNRIMFSNQIDEFRRNN